MIKKPATEQETRELIEGLRRMAEDDPYLRDALQELAAAEALMASDENGATETFRLPYSSPPSVDDDTWAN